MTLDTLPVKRVTVTDHEALLRMIVERQEIHLPYSDTTLAAVQRLRNLTDIPVACKKTAIEHEGHLKLVYRVTRRTK